MTIESRRIRMSPKLISKKVHFMVPVATATFISLPDFAQSVVLLKGR